MSYPQPNQPQPQAQQTPQPQNQRMPQPQPVSHRLGELLEAIKQEFVTVSSEASAYLMHKDQFDQKLLNQHMNELQQVRKTIYELDIAHRKMKEQYEEEILRLKRQLDHNIPAGASAQRDQKPSTPQVPAPQIHQPAFVGNAPPMVQPPGQGTPQQQSQQVQPNTQLPAQAQGQNSVQPTPQPQAQIPVPPINQQYYQQGPPPQQTPQPSHQLPAVGTADQSPSPNQILPQIQAPQAHAPQSSDPSPTTIPAQTAPVQDQPQGTPAGTTQQAAQGTPQASGAGQPAPGQNTPPAGQTPAAAPAASAAPVSQSEQWSEDMRTLGNNLPFLDTDNVPPHAIKSRDDWLVLFNEHAPRQLDVDLIHDLEHTSVVCCVRFSNDGKYLATGCNRSAQIYDVASGKLLCSLEDESVTGEEDLYIRSVCFSPDSTLLATGAEDHRIRVWDIATRKLRHVFSGHEQDIYSLDISRNGHHIASGSGDSTVRIWDINTGECILKFAIEGGVTAVSISPDGRLVAAGSLDHIVRVWDTTTGMLVERLEAPDGHKDSVYSVAFTHDGMDLVSGSLDKTIKLWQLQASRGQQPTQKGGVCVRTIHGHEDFVLSVATTVDGKWILSGSKDRGVQFWDPTTGQAQLMIQAHTNSVISVAASPVGQMFATGSGDCWAKIWRYFPAGSAS